MTKIISCNCKHEAQDKIHGKSMRVYNKTAKKVADSQAIFRCTVCSTEKTAKL